MKAICAGLSSTARIAKGVGERTGGIVWSPQRVHTHAGRLPHGPCGRRELFHRLHDEAAKKMPPCSQAEEKLRQGASMLRERGVDVCCAWAGCQDRGDA